LFDIGSFGKQRKLLFVSFIVVCLLGTLEMQFYRRGVAGFFFEFPGKELKAQNGKTNNSTNEKP